MNKSIMKRLISLMLAVVMVLSMTNLQVFAAEIGDEAIAVSDVENKDNDIITQPDAETEAAVISETEEAEAEVISGTEESRSVAETSESIMNRADSGIEVTDSIFKRTVFPDRPGSLGTEKQQKRFVHTLSDFQPTGLLYYPTQEFTITVSGDPSDPTPSVVFSQGWYRSILSEDVTKTVKLKYGVNKVNAPRYYITGAVYISNQYSEAEQKMAPTITIESEELQEYPLYYKSGQSRSVRYLDKDGKEGRFDDFEHFKEVLVDFKKNKVDKYNGNSIWDIIYPEISDFFTDSYLITSTTTGAYGNFITGTRDNGSSLGALYGQADIDDVLRVYDEALFDMYNYAGLKRDSIDPRHSYPKNRLHMRIMDDGLCHRASKNHFYMDGGEGQELQYSLLRNKDVLGWGLLHEMGHMVENSNLRYLESTNNLYVLDRQIARGAGNRLVNEERWDSLFSKFSSQKNLEFRHAQYGFDYTKQELTIWDRLVMLDQLNQYFRKLYPNSFPKRTADKPGWDFFTAMNAAVREESLVGPQFYDPINVMAYLTAKGIPDVNGNKIKLDIRPFLKRNTMDDVFDLFKWYGDMYGTPYPQGAEEISEYAHYIDKTYEAYKGNGLEFGVRGKITKIESAGMSNKLSMKLIDAGGKDVDTDTILNNVLGYEIYRGKEFIGYAKGQAKPDGTTVFTDCKTDVNANYVYMVLPIGRNLKTAGKSDGYSYKNTNAIVQGKINIDKIEYHSLTEELVVTGNGYTKRDFYRMVLNVDTQTDEAGNEVEIDGGVTYYPGLEKGDSYTRFFDRGFGNWEIHVTNFKTTSRESFSLMPQLQLCYTDENGKEVISSILTGQKKEYAYGAISMEGSESALLKSIKVTGLGHDENSGRKGDAQQILHFDPLVKEYTYKKYSDTGVSILNKPEGKITFIPIAADENAIYYTEVYDKEDMENPISSGKGSAEITFDRAANKEYVIKVVVQSNYGEPGCKTENYEFAINCPSEDAYLKNLKFKTKQIGDKEATMSIDSNLYISTQPWEEGELALNVTGTVKDDNLTITEFTPTADDSKAVVEYWFRVRDGHEGIKASKDEFTPLKLHGGSCELRITAADGVTVKKYHFTGEVSSEEEARAELRSVVGDFFYSKLARPVDTKNDDKIYFSITSDPEKDERLQPEIKPAVLYATTMPGKKSAKGQWVTNLVKGADYKITEISLASGDGNIVFLNNKAVESLKEGGDASLIYKVTSPDGKHTRDYRFYYEPLSEPVITTTNMKLAQGNSGSLLYAADTTDITSAAPDIKNLFNAKTYEYIFKTVDSQKIRFIPPTVLIGSSELWADGKKVTEGSAGYDMGPSTQAFKWILTVPSGNKFTYNIRRFRSTDTKVTNLEINAGALYNEKGVQISFDPEVKDYTLKVNDLSEISFAELTAGSDATVLIFLDGVLQENLVSKVKTRAAKAATKALRAAAKAAADTEKVQNLEIQVQAANGETQTYNFQVELAAKQLDIKLLKAAISRKDTAYASNPTEKGYTETSFKNLASVYEASKTLLGKAEEQNKTTPQNSEGLILQTEVDTQAAALQKAMSDLVLVESVVTITQTQISEAKLVLEKEQSTLLTARVNYSDGSFAGTGFIWESSDPSKVSVSNGQVKALGVTDADNPVTVTVTPEQGKYPGASNVVCKVTVIEKTLNPIQFTHNSSSILLNGNVQLIFKTEPTADQEITYTSSDPNVVSVDSNGKVEGKTAGSATVTAAYKNAPNISDTCIITVAPPEYTAVINTTATVTDMTVGATAALTAEVKENESNVTPPPVIAWTSSNTAVASVDENGVVTANDAGTATINAMTDYVKNPAAIEVSVAKPSYEIAVEGNVPAVMYVGGICDIGARVSMKTAVKVKDAQDNVLPIVYGTSDSNIATVDLSGKVKAVGTGKVTITAAYARDTTVNKTMEITVKGISLVNTGDIYVLKGGHSVSFGAVADGETKIEYTSDKEAIATVDGNGNITAVAPGEANITAKIQGEEDASGKSRKVKIYDLTVPETLVLAKGETTNADIISVSPGNTPLIVGTAGNDTSVVKVNGDHSLTATDGGSAEVTVKIDGTDLSKKFTVKVVSMDMDLTQVTLGVGEKIDRSALLKGETGETKVSYVSSDANIATVDDKGIITAVKEGTVKITASLTVGEKTLSKELTVKVWDIHLTKDTIAMSINDTNTAIGATASEGVKLRYSTTDTQIISVDPDTGRLNPVAVGTGTVKAAVAGSNVTKNIKVHVYNLTLGLDSTLSNPNYMEAGQQTQITPGDGIGGLSGASYSYAVTSGGNLAAVDGNGRVTTKAGTTENGVVQVKVTMLVDGQEKMSQTANLGVYWIQPFTENTDLLAVNNKITLTPTLRGKIPSEAVIEFSSSDTTVGDFEKSNSLTHLTGKKAGKVTVTARAGGMTLSKEFTVWDWEMPSAPITLVPGTSYDWVPVIEPAGVEMKPTFSVASGTGVSIDTNGKITVDAGAAGGKATVKASLNGTDKTLTVNIAPITFEANGSTGAEEVQAQLTNMPVNSAPIVLTMTLELPDGATAPVLTYESSNPNVAAVNAVESNKAVRTVQKTYKAEITPVGEGTTVITVKNGNTVLKEFTASVKGSGNTAVITDVTDPNNVKDVEVKAQVVRTDKYRIEMNWGTLEYTYDFGTWNPDTHTWNKQDQKWTVENENDDKITLINHSSMPVDVALEAKMFKDALGTTVDTSITPAFDSGNNFSLKSWVEGQTDANEDVKKTVGLSFTGTPDTNKDSSVRKGSAVITITGAQETTN